MAEIVSDGTCLQIIFIVCKYSAELDPQDEQAIMSILQQRFLLLGESASNKEHARAAAKAGSLMDMSVLNVPETPHMQGVLECLHILGIRFPKMEGVIRQSLDDIITSHPSNEPLVKRIRALQTKLKACQTQGSNPKFAFGVGVTDFSLCPPIELLDSFDSHTDKFTLDYKKPSTSYHSKHSKYYTPQTPQTHKILSGSSDPFFVAASHLMRPDLYSILLRVRIRNQMSFAYSNLSVSIGLCGALQPCDGYDTPQTIKKLVPEEKVDLEFPILVTSFEMGSATVHLSFSSLSPGDLTLDLETSLDYENYGKNYVSTSVISDVYGFEVGEFLHPIEYTPSEFLSEWNRFPAGFVLDVAFDPSIEETEILLEKLANHTSSSFHQVLRWSYSEQYFQLAYSAMTWFEDQLCFTVIGQQPPSSDQIYARFAFRASDPLVLSIFHGQIDRWLNSCAGVGKYSFITNNDENIFCATEGEDDPKLGSDELYEVEEGLLKQWKKSSRYSKPAPPIPAPPPKPVEAPPPAPAPAPPPPPPLPIDDDF